MHAYNVRCIIYRLSQSNHRLCVTLHTFVCKNTKIKHTISLFDNKYGKIFAFMSFSSIKSEKKGNTVQHFAIHHSSAYNTIAAMQKRPFDMTGKPLSPHHKAHFMHRNGPFHTTKCTILHNKNGPPTMLKSHFLLFISQKPHSDNTEGVLSVTVLRFTVPILRFSVVNLFCFQ